MKGPFLTESANSFVSVSIHTHHNIPSGPDDGLSSVKSQQTPGFAPGPSPGLQFTCFSLSSQTIGSLLPVLPAHKTTGFAPGQQTNGSLPASKRQVLLRASKRTAPSRPANDRFCSWPAKDLLSSGARKTFPVSFISVSSNFIVEPLLQCESCS